MKNTIRKGVKPRFSLSLDRPTGASQFRRVFPFKRSWIAIAIIATLDGVFLFPAITTFQQAASEWAGFNDLFDLVGALFLTGWLMGWSLAPILLTTVLILLLLGRETIRARPGTVELSIGLPLIGLGAVYQVAHMRNLRLEVPEKKSGLAWRGPHAVFDYGANAIAFGSSLNASDLAAISNEIQMAAGQSIRSRSATDEELEGQWAPSPLAQSLGQKGAAEAPEPDSATPLALGSPSTVLLILANLVPIFGAAFLGWRLSDVMVIYWMESAVIGFYNVLKMITISRWMALLSVPFFIGHFGAFMAVHFLFLYGLFVQGPDDLSGGDLREVYLLFAGLWPAIAALFISHGFSYFRNFLGRREYQGRNLKTQMAEPYTRIVFMHLVLILGGGLTLILGQPTPVLLLVILAKIWVDLKAHLKQRVPR